MACPRSHGLEAVQAHVPHKPEPFLLSPGQESRSSQSLLGQGRGFCPFCTRLSVALGSTEMGFMTLGAAPPWSLCSPPGALWLFHFPTCPECQLQAR